MRPATPDRRPFLTRKGAPMTVSGPRWEFVGGRIELIVEGEADVLRG
jgi:hypothetical protein